MLTRGRGQQRSFKVLCKKNVQMIYYKHSCKVCPPLNLETSFILLSWTNYALTSVYYVLGFLYLRCACVCVFARLDTMCIRRFVPF